MNLALNKLPQVAESLGNHAEASRIKKMLYCLTKDVWENELTILDRYSLEQLLNDVVQSIPDINRLLSSLIRIVKNLNRQELYAPLAKDIVVALVPVYNMDVRKINQVELQKLINRAQGSTHKENFVCFNLMEFLVKEEAYKEMQKLPVNMAKFIGFAEVCTYALNRLPAMYVSSEEGKQYQLKKAEEIKEKIHAAVLQGIAAIRRDPLRKSTPIDLYDMDAHSVFAGFVLELEKLIPIKDVDDLTKIPVKELSDKAIETIRVYQASLQEIEDFLQAKNLTNSKITTINLAPTIKKVIGKILSKETVVNNTLSPSVLKEIEDFLWSEKLSHSKLTSDNLVSTLKAIIHQIKINPLSARQSPSAVEVLVSSPLKQQIIDLLNTYETLITKSTQPSVRQDFSASSLVETQVSHDSDPATADILDAHEQMIASLSHSEDQDHLQTSLSANYAASHDSEAAILDILDADENIITQLGESNRTDDLSDSDETQFMTSHNLAQRKSQQRHVQQTIIMNFDKSEDANNNPASLDDWYAL